MRAGLKNWAPYLVCALLSLSILGPLLLPGYILTLDMVFSPKSHFTDILFGLNEWRVSAGDPFYLAMQLASTLLPGWVWQKIILFGIFFLAGLGAWRLFPLEGTGRYFAVLLYVVNPFVYVRFLSGQWGVLAAYALTPFAVKLFLDLLSKGSPRRAIKLALLSTLVGLTQLHGFFVLFFAFLAILLVRTVGQRRDPGRAASESRGIALAASSFLVLNLYWLLPALTARGTMLERIGPADLMFFAPRAISDFGAWFDVASMHGFWRGGYIYAKDFLPFWWLLFAFLFYLAVYGFLSWRRDRDMGWQVNSMAAVGLVGLLLGAGVVSGLTGSLFEWLCTHLPLFAAFRDSQKFVALLCLAYSYLGGTGVAQLAANIGQPAWPRIGGPRRKAGLSHSGLLAVLVLALLTPLLYTFPIFGFHGQIKATDYPREWYTVNDYLMQDREDFNVLFLPWHMYMDFDWLPNRDKRLANPAHHFFGKPIISGDNVEAGPVYSQSTNPVSKYVESLLNKRNELDNWGELLAPSNVKYVILAHEADYQSYQFLHKQPELTAVFRGDSLTLFRNEHPRSRVYGVDGMVYIQSLEEYLELSRRQDVMDYVYFFGQGTGEPPGEGMQQIDFHKMSPVKYHIGGTTKKWVVFPVPQRISTSYWEYGGHKATGNLGFMPVFPATEAGGELVYTRFYQAYVPAYAVSAGTLLASLLALLLPRRLTRLR